MFPLFQTDRSGCSGRSSGCGVVVNGPHVWGGGESAAISQVTATNANVFTRLHKTIDMIYTIDYRNPQFRFTHDLLVFETRIDWFVYNTILQNSVTKLNVR